MSLILEALRKSEAERRRGQAPDLFAELPPATHRRGPALSPWYWLLLALVLCATIAWLLRERWAPPAAPVAASAARTVAMAPTTSDAATVAAPDSVPGVVVATQGSEVVPEAAADVVQAPPPVASQPAVSPLVDSQPAGRPTDQDTTPVEGDVVPPTVVDMPTAIPTETQLPVPPTTRATTADTTTPTTSPSPTIRDSTLLELSDLTAAQRRQLPPLKLSMHLWNQDPSRRFVIIDGARLGEGDRIGEAVIDRIAADSVVLDWNGRRLRLPLR